MFGTEAPAATPPNRFRQASLLLLLAHTLMPGTSYGSLHAYVVLITASVSLLSSIRTAQNLWWFMWYLSAVHSWRALADTPQH